MGKRRTLTELEAMRVSDKEARTRIPGVAFMVFTVLILLAVLTAFFMVKYDVPDSWVWVTTTMIALIATYVLLALKVADQWEKAVVLRFGRFTGLRGPGIVWIVPVVDRIPVWIDHRVMVTAISAEKTLTKDTVPVDVDAVLFWLVWDAEKAALEVENYRVAIAWAAQTALREVIGQMDLADILIGRARMDRDLQKIIDERTTPWG